jgi:hypothetical protein
MEKNSLRGALRSILSTKYYSDKKNKMGRYCGTYGRQQTCIQGFESGDLRERDQL